jgi:SynChlorMet cassette radical SAM/SPASM protein ScmF
MDFEKIQLPEGIYPLTTYYMYLTGGCNLACRHCWIAPTYQANGSTGGHLDYGLYEIAIKEALPLGLRNIKFTGGEPLLHPDFVRMADYATEQNLSTVMETNGTLITPKLARHLKEKTSLWFISVSMDGATAASHDHMRNVPGSFERARKGILDLIDAGYRPQIIMSLYPGNVGEIEALVRWAEKVGCGSVKFNLLQPSGRGEQMKHRGEFLDISELVKLGHWVEDELRTTVSIPLFYSWPMAFHTMGRLLNTQGELCNIENILGVLASGHLAMCGIGSQEPDLVYGQLGKQSVREIWVSEPVGLKFHDTIIGSLKGICSECIHLNHCKGNCLAQNYYASKTLTASFWFCQDADANGLFPLSRKKDNLSVKTSY